MPRILGIILVLGAMAAVLFVFLYQPHQQHTEAPKFAQVDIKPDGSIYGLAFAARTAIIKGDYAAADKVIADVESRSNTTDSWYYAPYATFFHALVYGNDNNFLPYLDKWVDADDNAASRLVRAEYYYDNGWSLRGGGFANDVTDKKMLQFSDYLHKALDDVGLSIERKKNPMAYLLTLKIMGDIEGQEANENFFKTAIAQYPDYYPLYSERLHHLTPKWGGTMLGMTQFVLRYSEGAPQNSPLPFLYIELYSALTNDRKTNCGSLADDAKRECNAYTDEYVTSPKAEARIRAILKPYAHINYYPANHLLVEKLTCGCTPLADLKRLVDWAADELGQDNYAVNYIYGYYYAQNFNYKSSNEYYGQAIREIHPAHFPTPEIQNEWLATVYEKVSLNYQELYDVDTALKYQDAAIGLNAMINDYFWSRCQSYETNKKWQKAVDDCSVAIALHDTPGERYLRGQAYQKLGANTKAIADYKAVMTFPADDPKKQLAAGWLANMR